MEGVIEAGHRIHEDIIRDTVALSLSAYVW
jgi:hypothetical protein